MEEREASLRSYCSNAGAKMRVCKKGEEVCFVIIGEGAHENVLMYPKDWMEQPLSLAITC